MSGSASQEDFNILSDQVAELATQVTQLQSDNAAFTSNNAELSQQVAQLQAQVQTLDQQVRDATTAAAEATAAVQQMQAAKPADSPVLRDTAGDLASLDAWLIAQTGVSLEYQLQRMCMQFYGNPPMPPS
jgi:uncharacterized protein YlxW (UPF0749 family)